jgi:predicted dehydrogenase
MRTKVRVGLVGAGAMGDIHLRLLSKHSQVEVVGVCDIDPKLRSRIEKEYPFRT